MNMLFVRMKPSETIGVRQYDYSFWLTKYRLRPYPNICALPPTKEYLKLLKAAHLLRFSLYGKIA